MPDAKEFEPFIKLLTQHQSRVYAFIYSMLADAALADDVFQETNMVLWRKAGEYDFEREFLPWAFAIARNQVRAARQKTGRDRLLFDDESVNRIADRMMQRAARHDDRRTALSSCLDQLPAQQQELVDRRYQQNQSLDEIASDTRRTANTVAVTIHRLRQSLAKCIEQKLAHPSFE